MSAPIEPNPRLRSLRGIRTLIALRQDFAKAIADMQKSEDQYAVLQQLGYQLGWHVDKQLAGVMGHAQRHTDIFDAPLIVDATCGTDWRPAELRSRPMTVYAIVPGDKLVVWSGWLRVVLGSLLRIITRGKPTEKNPILFLVDECGTFGRPHSGPAGRHHADARHGDTNIFMLPIVEPGQSVLRRSCIHRPR